MITAGAAALKAAWQRDVFHYAASLAAVQGGVLLAQVLVARVLGPGLFGTVRVVEASLQLLAIPAGAGMASAIVRYTATAVDEGARRRQLAAALAWTALMACGVAVLVALVAPALPLSGDARHYLRWLVWSLVFTSIARTTINYYQGRGAIRQVAGWNVGLAALAVVCTVGGAVVWGVPGWGAGRVLGEVLLALGLLWSVRAALARPRAADLRPLAVFGGWVMLSLALDRVASVADTLYLDVVLEDPVAVGQYGVAVLATTAAMLLPAAAMAVALPRIAERSADVRAAWTYARRLLGPLVSGTLVLAALLVVAGPPIIESLLGSAFAPSGPLLRWLSLAFVASVLVTYFGTFLLAVGRVRLAVIQSVVGVVVNIGVNAVLIPRYGATGAAAAAIATASARAVVLAVSTAWVLRSAPRVHPTGMS